ncbi:MAG: glycosyltransferase family 39 protein [Acidobacteria bacterium]|nr:glycosyltransferase family 39 protein [Acidobacteriota bacterium]
MRLPWVLPVVLLGLLLGLSTLAYPWTDWDTPSATYLGQVVLEGGAPYREAWNVKAPGVYFAYALSILLSGKSALGIRIFDLLWQCATALVLAGAGARMFRSERAGLFAGFGYLLVYYSQNYWNWAEADGLISLPLAAGFLFLLRGMESDRGRDWGLAAFWVGLAALFKLIFGFVGVAMLAAAFVKPPAWRGLLLRRVAPLAVGVSLPLLATAAYLRSHGALDEFLLTQFVVAPELTGRLRALVHAGCIVKSLVRPVLLPLYIVFFLAVYSLGRTLRRRMEWRVPAVFCGAWFLTGALTLVLHGAYFGYHFLPLFAPLAVLAGSAFETITDKLWPLKLSRKSLLALAGLGLLCLMPVVKLGQRAYFSWQVLSGRAPAVAWRELGTYLRERTKPDDQIFVWGNVPALYLYAERRSCSRFIFSYFLSLQWKRVNYQPAFLAELRAGKPRYFVLIKEGKPNACSGHEIGALEAFERFSELKQIVAGEYETEKETVDYIVYRRRTEKASEERGRDAAPGT